MKIFAIRNESDNNKTVGYLFYYEKKKRFYIELPDDTDEWETPILLSSFVKKGQRTINSKWSRIWVEQRIVPSDRQNIGQILKDNKLSTYDEFNLLMLAGGRCAQDDFFLSSVTFEELPQEIKNRKSHRIDDIIPLENNRILVFFSNNMVKICEISKIVSDDSPLGKMLISHPEYFKNVSLQVGGFGICWDENMTITDMELFENGKQVPLSKEDFCSFIYQRVVNTAEACELLGCSRQYINELIKQEKLKPIKENEKGKLFLKSDIEKREWN